MTAAARAPEHRRAEPPKPGRANALDRFFTMSARGSSPLQETRGGIATFFTMAYIIVLNPIILSGAHDKYGHHLSHAQLVTATCLVAGVMTVIMGVAGNLPLAIAAGLGLNGVVAFQIAPEMSWPDAMGLVVLSGVAIVILVVTGLRQMIMDAIPLALKQAIGVGIGLFIAFIGLVDAGFITRTPDKVGSTVPVTLGPEGHLKGWPTLIFCLGVMLTFILLIRKVKGAILISIVSMTVLAMVVNAVADVPAGQWGLITPELPDSVVGAPDFGLVGNVSVFGAFSKVGVLTAVIFIFTLMLSDFFDAMGTIIGVSNEAGLLDEDGRLPGIGRVLLVDGFAAVAGGAASCSSNTCYVESTAGVGEGARTGFANLVTGGLFAVALFLTPLATVVPSQAATPALVVVGFLLMTQVKGIDWDDWEIAVPAFLTIVLMPLTYSITNGIGAGFLAFVLIKAATGKTRQVPWLLWVVAAFFLIYFAIDPVEQLLGID
ncbi:NCS2 family permease [Yinghuangia seranimata]|uniref:NCS2 family permease n=1 Tax=Yinghuangia seranimata TaxID=408067 RepID=UPI00248D1D3C|nr:NCS2 family permease [Yinghuangia seranimata]MDI2131245.1 NCS2 family permease [Yinghuangia seranimata]